VPFHVLQNADYKIYPYLSNTLAADYTLYLINGEIYNQQGLIATFNLSDVPSTSARVSQPLSLTRDQ